MIGLCYKVSTSLKVSLLLMDLSIDSMVVRPVIELSYSAKGRFRFLCAGNKAIKLSWTCYFRFLCSMCCDKIDSRVMSGPAYSLGVLKADRAALRAL